jgi:hypothetical protein
MTEDMDRMAVAEPLAGDELERMLARYARVRLDPDPSQVRRARTAVMADAWRHRLATDPGHPVARRGLFSGWSSRRLGLSLAAAVFAGLILGSTAFATSRAGGPLYETRLALEALGLPLGAAARVDSRIEAAQARLAEAVEAAGRHDSAATTAALDAYDRVIDDLLSADGTAAERALEAVQFHHAILLEIAGSVPEAAAGGIERALLNSERVIDRLNASVNATGAPEPNGNGNAGGNGIGSPEGRPAPTDKGQPAATKAPDATSKPHPTPNPPSKPEKTSQPRKSAPSSAP